MQPRTLKEVQDIVMMDAVMKWDDTTKLGGIVFDSTGSAAINDETNDFTDYAMGQLCKRVITHGGARFVQHGCGPELQATILNKKLTGRVKPVLIRGRGNMVRAVLTERYSKFDNGELVDALRQAVSETKIEIKGWHLTDHGLFLRVVFPATHDPRGGGLTCGVGILNSEVGLRSVTITSYVYRLICSNGLMGWDKTESYRQPHLHLSGYEMTRRVSLALAKQVKASESLRDKMLETIEHRFKPAVTLNDVIDEIVEKRHEITDSIANAWKLNLDRNEHNVFALVNGLTAAAREKQGEARVSLETLAGRMVNWQNDGALYKILEPSVVR